MNRWIRWVMLACFALTGKASAATAMLHPVADTTLHEKFPANSLGAHFDVAAGATGTSERLRALLKFDIQGQLPPGAVITSATLTLRVTREPSSGGAGSTFELRRVQKRWLEGTKINSNGQEATAGEVTWASLSHPDTPWAAPGGAIGTDFAGTVTSAVAVAGRGSYAFPSTPNFVADLKIWLAKPDENFGWAVLSQAESVKESGRRFASREDAANAPTLAVEYDLPASSQIRMTSITIKSAEGNVTWSGGVGPFQLQRRAALGAGEWVNVGVPVPGNSATFPVEGTSGFLRVSQSASPPSAETAEYEVTFKSDWSLTSHPQSFPSGAHWSPLVGGTHNDQVIFWEENGLATNGIEDMAELGSVVALRTEINAAIAKGTAFNVFNRPGSIGASATVSLGFTVHRNFPLVTLVTMIAPSPDWFTGVHGLNLLENGSWVPTRTVVLNLYDAGTDSAITYSALDADTQPRERIRQITGFPALVGGQLMPFGTFTFTRK